MPLQAGPCEPWDVDLCCDVDDIDPVQVTRWATAASFILWALSGRRYGPSCPITVRPCRRSCMDAYPLMVNWAAGAGPWIPYIGVDGQWRNASVCGCKQDCSCTELCEVRLDGPVYDIVEVNVDGVVLPGNGAAYRVDSPNLLVRLDGECWPDCQDMAEPAGTDGTFTVTYRTGLPLDPAATAAVSELTCHFLRGCSPGTCGCKANRNVTKINRQNYQMEFADPTLIYSEGRTGLPLADLWLAAVNPYRMTSPSRVYSPDYKRPRVTTWP